MPTETRYERPTKVGDLVAFLKSGKASEREVKALQALKSEMAKQFRYRPESSLWKDASMLSKVATQKEFQNLIAGFVKALTDSTTNGGIPELRLLSCFTNCLRGEKHEISCSETRFGAALASLQTHLMNAVRFNDPWMTVQLLHTAGTLLDAMVDIKITGIDRETLHQPLDDQLRVLAKDPNPRIAQAASYARQALRRIPDNESPWNEVLRHCGTAIEAGLKITTGALKLDPQRFVDAGPELMKLLQLFTEVAKGGKEIWETREDLKQVIHAMTDVSARKGYYDALRQTDLFIQAGAYEGLKMAFPLLKCANKDVFWCCFLSQLEFQWSSDESARENLKDFLKWILEQPSLKAAQTKGKHVDEWVLFLRNLTGLIPEEEDIPRKRRRMNPGSDKKPKLESTYILPQGHSDDSDIDSPLIKQGMHSCQEARSLFADEALCHYYLDNNSRRLHIKRLSKDLVPLNTGYLDQCLVRKSSLDQETVSSAENQVHQSETEGSLQDLFRPGGLRGGDHERPRRILIRGRAGVGKSTLCKKIVHDILDNRLWADLFDRVVWVPLRTLRDHRSFEHFLEDEVFRRDDDNGDLCRTFKRMLNSTEKMRTLFVLDGLDEIFGVQREGKSVIDCFSSLLNRRDAIITSRPHAVFPSKLDPFDVEFEATGLTDDQIFPFIDVYFSDNAEKLAAVKDFVKSHSVLKPLLQVPIQIDALCCAWEDATVREQPLTTMTALYQSIEILLWRKDMVRMGRRANNEVMAECVAAEYQTVQQIHSVLGNEIEFVRSIAFFGLFNNVTEFDWKSRMKFYTHHAEITDAVLSAVSVMRSTDAPLKQQYQNYYFLHSTFQEYFAAQHFVQHWKLDKDIPTVNPKSGEKVFIRPADLVIRERDNGRYNIMWRFVTGILAGEAKGNLERFLEQIKREPRNLLGHPQNRILMDCLNEVGDPDLKENLATMEV